MDPHHPIQVQFHNQVNPNSAFDLVKLEDMLKREYSNHSPEELHKVEFFILIIITEGEGYHNIDFTKYKYRKGSILTVRKDQIHQFFLNPNTQGYLLLFTDDFLVSYLEKLEAEKSIQLFNELLGIPKIQLSETELTRTENLVHRIQDEYLKVFDEYTLGIIRSELHILITTLFRIKTKNNPTLLDKKYLSQFITFQELVEKNASQTTRVHDYADMMAISTKTLNTISRSFTNKSAKSFIDDICTKQMKRLLINSPLSIKEIAYQSGFEETTNLYKYFKRQVGMTPEQFRNSF